MVETSQLINPKKIARPVKPNIKSLKRISFDFATIGCFVRPSYGSARKIALINTSKKAPTLIALSKIKIFAKIKTFTKIKTLVNQSTTALYAMAYHPNSVPINNASIACFGFAWLRRHNHHTPYRA